MMKMQRLVVSSALVCGLIAVAGCKQEAPPPPPTPSAAPLADAAPKVPVTSQLPPGHPPIGGQATPAPAKEPAGLPEGHPPIDGQASGDQTGAPKGHPPMGGGMPAMPSAVAGGDRKLLDEAPTKFAGITMTPPDDWKPFDPGNGMMAPVAAFVLEKAEGDDVDATARLTYFPNMRNMPQMIEMNLDRWYGQVQQPDGKSSRDVAIKETFEGQGTKITLVDMPGSIDGKPGQRMMAAIIEHPKGPHFLKVAGPDATMQQWRDSVIAYLKSAAVTP